VYVHQVVAPSARTKTQQNKGSQDERCILKQVSELATAPALDRDTQDADPIESLTARFIAALLDGNDFNLHAKLNENFSRATGPGITRVVGKHHHCRALAAQVFKPQFI